MKGQHIRAWVNAGHRRSGVEVFILQLLGQHSCVLLWASSSTWALKPKEHTPRAPTNHGASVLTPAQGWYYSPREVRVLLLASWEIILHLKMLNWAMFIDIFFHWKMITASEVINEWTWVGFQVQSGVCWKVSCLEIQRRCLGWREVGMRESAGESGMVSPELERKRSASQYVLTASLVATLPAAIMKANQTNGGQ